MVNNFNVTLTGYVYRNTQVWLPRAHPYLQILIKNRYSIEITIRKWSNRKPLDSQLACMHPVQALSPETDIH